MMEQSGTFKYAHPKGVQVLELPYAGRDMSMLLVLPDARSGLSAVEKRLSVALVDSWIRALEAQSLVVALPRFEMHCGIALKKPLRDLAMRLAFGETADFSGMTDPSELFIDDAYHEAFIKVDEEGTEAAAATAVVMKASAAPRTLSFVADHPFLFIIRDVASGTILLLGRVVDPPTK